MSVFVFSFKINSTKSVDYYD